MSDFKVGLRICMDNSHAKILPKIAPLFKKGVYDFIEVLAIPTSYKRFSKLVSDLNCDAEIHAPHLGHGVDLSSPENFEKNKEILSDALKFVERFNSRVLVVHPGTGSIDETIKQLKELNCSSVFIENLPPLQLETPYIGSKVADIKKIVDETGCGLCVDLAHAVYAAKAQDIDLKEYLTALCSITDKKHYHISDGDLVDYYDDNLDFGAGDFNINQLLRYIEPGSTITINCTPPAFMEDIGALFRNAIFLKQSLDNM